MSDSKEDDQPKQPEMPGFMILQAENGLWTMFAKGDSPWYITSFESASDAQDWVLEYLTTNIENSNRMHLEMQERRLEREQEAKAQMAHVMLATEAATREDRKRTNKKEQPN